MQKFLDAVVRRLPESLRPYAKALIPLTVGVAVVVQDLVISAAEVAELKTLAITAVTSLLVYATRNIGS